MRKSLRVAALPAILISSAAALDSGCGGDNVKLADAPAVQAPPSKPATEQPPDLRPRAGGSSGMSYNPGAINPNPGGGGGQQPK